MTWEEMLVKLGLMWIGIGCAIAAYNWITLLVNWWTGRQMSLIPFGGILLAAGLLLLPATRAYAWLGIVADCGTIALLLAVPRILTECWSTSRFNLVEEYIGQKNIQTVSLRLFRRGVFTLRQQLSRPRNQYGILEAGMIGQWERGGGRLLLKQDGQCAIFEELSGEEAKGLRLVAGFPDRESCDELSMADVDLRLQTKRAATS